jgi:PspAB-like protein
VGLWDVLRGQQRAKAPNLDNLFAVPGAAVTLQTALDLTPTGVGSVCFRAAEGAASGSAQAVATTLVEQDGPAVERQVDSFGFTWLVVRGARDDVAGLVTDLHAVNSELELQDFAGGLLCSMIGFSDAAGRRLGLVYLYKRGTFYPFAPTGPQARDALFERQVRDALASDLTIEPDAARWLPVWEAPGL